MPIGKQVPISRKKIQYVIRIHDPISPKQLEFIRGLRDEIGTKEYDAVYCFPERDIRKLSRGQAADLIKLLLDRKEKMSELIQVYGNEQYQVDRNVDILDAEVGDE